MGRKRKARRRRRKRHQTETRNVDPDRISELPEHLLHHIFSFLPARDAVRTCVLSKNWRHAWSSLSILNFDSSTYPYRGSTWTKDFLEFVDEFLRRRDRNSSIEIFNVRTIFYKSLFKPIIDEWVRLAAHLNVKQLCLEFFCVDLISTFAHKNVQVYSLPPTIFRARSLTSLKLKRCMLELSWDSFSLPCLKEVYLIEVDMDDWMLHSLVVCCPVETLYLESLFMSSIQILSSTVKSLEVVFDRTNSTRMIKVIEASNLQSFRFKRRRYIRRKDRARDEVDIDVPSCGALNAVTLNGANLTDGELEKLVCQLRLLESLTLIDCYMLEHVRIFSESLKSCVINECNNLKEVDFDTPNLLRLTYTGKLIRVSSMLPLHLSEAKVDLLEHKDFYSLWVSDWASSAFWFAKLKRFLGVFNHAKVLELTCSDEAFIFPKDLRVRSPPLCELKHLEVKFTESAVSESELVRSLLWLCPSLETLAVYLQSIDKCFKINLCRGPSDRCYERILEVMLSDAF